MNLSIAEAIILKEMTEEKIEAHTLEETIRVIDNLEILLGNFSLKCFIHNVSKIILI